MSFINVCINYYDSVPEAFMRRGHLKRMWKCQLWTNENVLFWTAQGKSLNQYKRDLDTNTRELQKLPVYIKILASVMRRELAYNLITEVIKQITGSRHKQVIKARIN